MRIIEKEEVFDSKMDTNNHRKLVLEAMTVISKKIMKAAEDHDLSKLEEPEKPIFDTVTPLLKGLTYGSQEYKDQLKKMGPALDHHYANNSHHPEHYENGIDGMDLVDIVEMICDWKAATMRHDDGDIQKSLEINKKRFKMSDQLVSILKNTVERYFEN